MRNSEHNHLLEQMISEDIEAVHKKIVEEKYTIIKHGIELFEALDKVKQEERVLFEEIMTVDQRDVELEIALRVTLKSDRADETKIQAEIESLKLKKGVQEDFLKRLNDQEKVLKSSLNYYLDSMTISQEKSFSKYLRERESLNNELNKKFRPGIKGGLN